MANFWSLFWGRREIVKISAANRCASHVAHRLPYGTLAPIRFMLLDSLGENLAKCGMEILEILLEMDNFKLKNRRYERKTFSYF